MTQRHISGKTARRQEKAARRNMRESSVWEDMNQHHADVQAMLGSVDEMIELFNGAQANGIIRADDEHYNTHIGNLKQALVSVRSEVATLKARHEGRTGQVSQDDLQLYLTIMGDYTDMFQHYNDRLMPVTEHLSNYVASEERAYYHKINVQKVQEARSAEKAKEVQNESN